MNSNRPQQICLLGSTGSIGTQTLDVIAQHQDRYEVYCLTANSHVELLAAQAHAVHPACVVIADETKYDVLTSLLDDMPDVNVYAGAEALDAVVTASDVDTVVVALVGFAGLSPTIHAIEAGKKICLANKETLVVAGQLVLALAQQYHTPIIPIDSEHSAIFQCLVGEDTDSVERLLLTASGGPFRTFSIDQLATVTASQALQHPTWTMGAKITIDSATMMNKGFEVIEAHWLFGIPVERIQVLIHPQSIVHSAVLFHDGAVKAQLGVPDMRVPIQYALSYPDRLALSTPRVDLFAKPLEFFHPDMTAFPCLQLAIDALHHGGTTPCAMNAANEIANLAFRQGRCSFPAIATTIATTMERTPYIGHPTLADLLATDAHARAIASSLINQTYK